MKPSRWRIWYPPSWWNRFGEEYEQLLDDLRQDRPLSLATRLDIVQRGVALHASTSDGRRRLLGFATALVTTTMAVMLPLLIAGSAGASPALNVLASHKCDLGEITILDADSATTAAQRGFYGAQGIGSPFGCSTTLQANNERGTVSHGDDPASRTSVRGDEISIAFTVTEKSNVKIHYTLDISFPNSVLIAQYVRNGTTWTPGLIGNRAHCYSVLAKFTTLRPFSRSSPRMVNAVVLAINEFPLEPFTECNTYAQSPPFPRSVLPHGPNLPYVN